MTAKELKKNKIVSNCFFFLIIFVLVLEFKYLNFYDRNEFKPWYNGINQVLDFKHPKIAWALFLLKHNSLHHNNSAYVGSVQNMSVLSNILDLFDIVAHHN